MINISSLANFLSINAKEINDISSITNESETIITISLKKKDCFCSHCRSSNYKLKEYKYRKIKHALFLNIPKINCLSPVKETIKKRPETKDGNIKSPEIDIPSYLLPRITLENF